MADDDLVIRVAPETELRAMLLDTVYQAASVKCNTESLILDNNTRYFGIVQGSITGFMIATGITCYINEAPVLLFLLATIPCFFALWGHAKYTERRARDSFQDMRVAEGLCGRFERRSLGEPLDYFYAHGVVRRSLESREFANQQLVVVAITKVFWGGCSIISILAVTVVLLFKATV